MATLTGAQLTTAYFLQKDMFADSARKADYIAEVNAAKALIENTTAKIVDSPLSNPDKKQSVRIFWNKMCDTTVSTTDPEFCTPSGAEADAGYEDFTLNAQVSSSFTLDEANYENSNLNIAEVYADNMLKKKKLCDEKMAQVLVSKLDGFTSNNLYTTKGIACPGVVSPESWASTYIPPAMWTPELMNYFRNVSRINKFSNPFLLDGKNLNATAWLAMYNAANANGAGAASMMKAIKYYEDLVNVEAVSPGKTFLVDRGVTAFVSRCRWTKNSATNPIIEPLRRKYSEASDNIPGLKYDVYIYETCSGPYTKYNVQIHAMFDLFNGAPNCNNGTGVLEFICGACPT